MEANKLDPLAVDPFAEVFCRAAGGIWAGLLDGGTPGHPLHSAEFGTHFVTYQGARTRHFDDYFRAAADAGVRQIVILAASVGRQAPTGEVEVSTMIGSITLVTAIKK